MITVNNNTKEAYISDTSKKQLRVYFPELSTTYDNESIEKESLKITESLSSSNSVEFVGCIASSCQINIYGVNKKLKGKKIEVYIKADQTEEIPLFKGIVDSVVIDSNKYFNKVTAYDPLYELGNLDVVGWYNQQFPSDDSTKTLKQIRDSLCTYIGITQVTTTLPNDNVVIPKKYDPKSLKCSTVLKSICQINGCCGIVNRNGYLDYRFISGARSGMYPALTLYPASTTYPQYSNKVYTFPFYESLNYEEYSVKPMEKVQIRDDDDSDGVTVGTGSNKYIIQSNMFAKDLDETVLESMATNILTKLENVNFHPFDSKNNGLPFVEVGDAVVYSISNTKTGRYATNAFFILSRTLSGIQFLRDSYSAEGNEEQSEFITDLQAQIETLKMNGGGGTPEDVYTKDETDALIDEKIAEESLQVVSCTILPPIEQRNKTTIYLVQGDIYIN